MQRDRRAPDSAAPRLRLLSGAAAVALAASAGGAWAQTAPASTAQAGPDGLEPDGVYLEADVATRAGDLITASGAGADRVLARFRGATLRAGEVTYDLGLGVATAQRRVEFVDPGGS